MHSHFKHSKPRLSLAAKALSVLTILSLLLPSGLVASSTIARAQEASTDTVQAIPVEPPAPQFPEALLTQHPTYGQTAEAAAAEEVVVGEPAPEIESTAVTAAAAELDAEALKSGVVSGQASATLSSDGKEVRLGNLPLLARWQGVSSSGAGPAATLQADVWAVEKASELSPVGVAFTLGGVNEAISASQAEAPLELIIDYSQIPIQVGGSFKNRLTLYRVRNCTYPADVAAQAETPCQTWEALSGSNDVASERLTVNLSAPASSEVSGAASEETTVEESITDPTLDKKVYLPAITNGLEESAGVVGVEGEDVYVLAAAASGQEGSYKATPLANIGDYQVSLANGSAQSNYPIAIPPAAGPLAPSVSLNYDSGGVDGANVNKNNQPGWTGIGWNLHPGYITRRLKGCGVSQAPGDLCLTGDNYVLVFNGVSSVLIKDGAGLYHPQNDPRWKLEKKTDGLTGHPDTQKEYWLLTTQDGTKYRFGGEFDTEKSNADQDSAFYVPVYDSGACSAVSAYWVCNKVYQWNLDRVQDTRGNIVAYYYSQEINYYNVRNGIFRWPYTRAGNPARIEYGRRTASTATPTQVVFNTEERCEGACTWPTNYPDTPGDLTCASTGACSQNAPTFWSRKRLNTIVTQYFTTVWVNVATTDLDYSFPTPPLDADGDSSEKKLWLSQIVQKDGANANPLPATQYSFTMLKNRRDAEGAGGAGISALIMPRLNQITLPLGGVVRFVYGQSHPCPNSQSGFVQYPYDCYPAWNSFLSGWTLWHKWKVLNQVMSDTFSLNDTQTITYSYSTPINHYDDDPVTPVANKSWSDFRGSQIVTVIDDSGAKTEHRFHRGMHGDSDGAGGTISVSITDSNGVSHGNDENWLRGRTYEVRRLTSANAARSQNVTWYTSSQTAAATPARTSAYFVGTSKAETTAYGTANKTTRVEYTYDSYGNVTAEKLYGDIAISTDDRNTQRSFLANTTAYIVDKPQWEKLWAGLTPGVANAEKSFSDFAYDNLAIGTAPTVGNLTQQRNWIQFTPVGWTQNTTIVYDAYGRPTTVTNGNGQTTTTAYHATYGYVTTVTNHLSHVTTSVNDPGFGVPTTITDANGKVTTLQYDTHGRLTKVWLPSEPTSGVASLEFAYTLTSYPAKVQSRQLQSGSNYLESWGFVDGFGRDLQSQTKLLNGNRTVSSKKYNKLGQLVFSSAPYEATGAAGSGYTPPTWTSLSNYHYLQYEELGNVWLDETKSGSSVQWSNTTIHDGWQKRNYDPKGNRTDYDNDGFGKLAKVTEWNVGSVAYNTTYAYDVQGSLTSVTDHLGNVTSMTYDLIGRKKTMVDPDMGSWEYYYDAVGNLTWQKDARGLWVVMAYDNLNRLVNKKRDWDQGTLIADYTYDAVGQKGLLNKTRSYNSAGSVVEVEIQNVTYDARNRLTQQNYVVNGVGTFRLDSAFNAADQKTSMVYPGGTAGQQGETVSYGYNTIGQLSTVSGLGGIQYVSSATYNAQGQMTQMVNENGNGANGLTRQMVYNANTLRLETIKAGTASPFENLQKLSYVYDFNGNVTSLVDSSNSSQKQCFQYDWRNRLTAAFTGDAACTAYNATGTGPYNHSYAYNEIGNITNFAGNAYTYGDTAHKHAVTAAFGNSYGYDANGNQTSRTISGTAYTFSYDYENRITTVSGGSTSASYVYDAGGMRVKGTIGGVTTVYIAGVYEYQAGATTLYYEGNAIRRTGYASNNGVTYLLQDHLKSSSALINQNGTVNGNRNYFLPFGGNRVAPTAFNDTTTKRFTGQYHEKDLPGGEGLSYYGARWYDAKLGRFLSADSIVPGAANPQSLNRYSYVKNSPTNRIDPSGHYDIKPGDAPYSSKPQPSSASVVTCAGMGCSNQHTHYVYLPVFVLQSAPTYNANKPTQYSFPQYNTTASKKTSTSQPANTGTPATKGWFADWNPDFYFEGGEFQGGLLAGLGRGGYLVWDAQNLQLIYVSGNYGGFTGLGFGFTGQAVQGFGYYSSDEVNPKEVLAGRSREAGPDVSGFDVLGLSLSRGSNTKFAAKPEDVVTYWKLGGNLTYGAGTPVSYHWTESNATTVQLLIGFKDIDQMEAFYHATHPQLPSMPDFFAPAKLWLGLQ